MAKLSLFDSYYYKQLGSYHWDTCRVGRSTSVNEKTKFLVAKHDSYKIQTLSTPSPI